MTPNEYCRQKALHASSDLYYSILFLPKKLKPIVIALYAFQKEISDIIQECHEESVARTKLNWWHEELEFLFEQKARHPITRAIEPHLKQYNFQHDYFKEIITGSQMDLDYNGYKTFDELYHYCFRTSSITQLLLAQVFANQTVNTEEYAKHIGMALSLSKILLQVRTDMVSNRAYIPLDELQNFKVNHKDLEQATVNENTNALFEFQYNRIKEFTEKAETALAVEHRHLHKNTIILTELMLAQLNEVQKDGFRILQHKIELTPIRKLWIAFRAK